MSRSIGCVALDTHISSQWECEVEESPGRQFNRASKILKPYIFDPASLVRFISGILTYARRWIQEDIHQIPFLGAKDEKQAKHLPKEYKELSYLLTKG